MVPIPLCWLWLMPQNKNTNGFTFHMRPTAVSVLLLKKDTQAGRLKFCVPYSHEDPIEVNETTLRKHSEFGPKWQQNSTGCLGEASVE